MLYDERIKGPLQEIIREYAQQELEQMLKMQKLLNEVQDEPDQVA